MAVLSPIVAGKLIAVFGTRKLMIGAAIGGIFLIILTALVLQSYPTSRSATTRALITLCVGGIGTVPALLTSLIYALLTCGYPEDCRGRGIGLGLMVGRVGGFIAIVLGGWMIGSSAGPNGLFILAGVGLVIVALCALMVDRHVAPATRSQ